MSHWLSVVYDHHGLRWLTTFVEAFAIGEQCDRALCQYDVIDLLSLLVDSSKSRKTPVATAWLVEAKGDNTLYCWSFGQLGHAIGIWNKDKSTPWIMWNKSQLFPLTIQQMRVIDIYRSRWNVPTVGGTITWWKNSSPSIHRKTLHSNGIKR